MTNIYAHPDRTATGTPRHTRIGGLDGLRAIAVTMVLVYHLFPAALPGGFLGVDVFFAISGFLITTLLYREWETRGTINLIGFLRRRARRLLPALTLVILVTSSLAVMIGGDVLYRIREQIVGTLIFASNWVFVWAGTDYFTQDSPELLRNTWSLAIEEQFYLVLPVLVLLLFKTRSRILTVTVFMGLGAISAIHMGSLSQAGADTTRIYFGSDSHVFGLLFGAALAVMLVRPHARAWARGDTPSRAASWVTTITAIAGMLVLAWYALTLAEGSAASFEGGFQVATLAALGVIAAVTWPGAPIARLLDAPPLRYIGERSYGIYLWHWPLLVLVQAGVASRSHLATSPGFVAITTLVLTLCASAVSYRFWEAPIRRHGVTASMRLIVRSRPWLTVPRRQRRLLLGAVVVCAVGVPFTFMAMVKAPQVTSTEAAIERGRVMSEPTPLQSLTPRLSVPENRPQHHAARAATPSPLRHGEDIIAIGDSVMLASAPEIGSLLSGADIDAEVSRGLPYAVSSIEDRSATNSLRPIIVVGLGTNGPINSEDLEAIAQMSGKNRLILVNAFADRWWIPEVNKQLHDFAEQHRGVVVADWHAGVEPHTDLLAGDLVHPHAEGGELYARIISDAIDALSSPEEVIGFEVPRR